MTDKFDRAMEIKEENPELFGDVDENEAPFIVDLASRDISFSWGKFDNLEGVERIFSGMYIANLTREEYEEVKETDGVRNIESEKVMRIPEIENVSLSNP